MCVNPIHAVAPAGSLFQVSESVETIWICFSQPPISPYIKLTVP